ncbi:acetyltransferase (GNAT) domain protein [Rhodobiaceae bacterium]|nr:acetyltransferase (GNAT) domain protein [Rhodobiaceae bacterium]
MTVFVCTVFAIPGMNHGLAVQIREKTEKLGFLEHKSVPDRNTKYQEDTPMSLSAQEIKYGSQVDGSADKTAHEARPSVLLSVHNEFSSVEAVWRRFEKVADGFAFQTFDFLETWFEHIGSKADIELQIVVAWGSKAKPLMILPLGIELTGSMRKLLWLGGDLNDYNGPLLAPNFLEHVAPGEFSKLWEDIQAVLPAYDIAELMRQPAMIDDQPNPFLELDTKLNASGAHMTSMGGDFDAYYDEKRNSKAKRHFRSRRKKLEEMGETVYVHPKSAKDIEASVEKLVELKSEALKAMGANDFLAKPGYADFYKALTLKSGSEGIAHVSHMEVAGDYVAGNWGLVHKGRFYYLLASYDGPKFGRFAPGVQALVETMKWAVGRGVDTFDFTIGDERYKHEWCETKIELHDHLSAETVKGRVALIRARMLLTAKRIIKQTPLLWESFTKLREKFAAK